MTYPGDIPQSPGAMVIDEREFDVLIIGSGAGGGTMAGALAAAGRKVLLLEQGAGLALADQNVADIDLFRRQRYHPAEEWIGTDGDPFAPQMVEAVGGNTKIWGGVLERMLPEEFVGMPMQEGSGPDWGLRYADLAPWYEQAEALYRAPRRCSRSRWNCGRPWSARGCIPTGCR